MNKTDPNAGFHTLQSALAYLMTRYGMITSLNLQHCPACCALTIVQHLNMLLERPQVQASKSLRNTYQGLLNDWESLGRHQEEHHPANQNFATPAVEKGLIH